MCQGIYASCRHNSNVKSMSITYHTQPYNVSEVPLLPLDAQLYIAWNYHERNPGEYKWDGPQDIEKFIGIVHKLDMLVILRPGPYICAEWDFGGLPAWLGSSAVSDTSATFPAIHCSALQASRGVDRNREGPRRLGSCCMQAFEECPICCSSSPRLL